MNNSRSTTEPSTTGPTQTELAVTEPAVTESQEKDAPRPPATRQSLAERTWWVPWLLGVAVIVVGVALVVQYLDDSPRPRSVSEQRKQALPHSDHTVVYEVTGAGKSPEIRFVNSGQGDADRTLGAALPWRKELTVSVGPTAGVVQVLAANSGQSDTISCSILVDGHVVNHQTATGAFSSVSCSAAINP